MNVGTLQPRDLGHQNHRTTTGESMSTNGITTTQTPADAKEDATRSTGQRQSMVDGPLDATRTSTATTDGPTP
jgi:hypothetical protein